MYYIPYAFNDSFFTEYFSADSIESIIVLITFWSEASKSNKDESVSYNGLITRNIDKANKYVNVTIKVIPYFYATKTSGDGWKLITEEEKRVNPELEKLKELL